MKTEKEISDALVKNLRVYIRKTSNLKQAWQVDSMADKSSSTRLRWEFASDRKAIHDPDIRFAKIQSPRQRMHDSKEYDYLMNQYRKMEKEKNDLANELREVTKYQKKLLDVQAENAALRDKCQRLEQDNIEVRREATQLRFRMNREVAELRKSHTAASLSIPGGSKTPHILCRDVHEKKPPSPSSPSPAIHHFRNPNIKHKTDRFDAGRISPVFLPYSPRNVSSSLLRPLLQK